MITKEHIIREARSVNRPTMFLKYLEWLISREKRLKTAKKK